MATTIGSGLGGFTAIAAQPTYGSTFVTPTRVLTFKTNKPTHDPHIVQGGPYLAGGRIVDIGSAHEILWLDAKGTITGDLPNTGAALLVATAFGSGAALTQNASTTAYELGGSTGFTLEAPDAQNGKTSGCCFDMQIASPTTDGVQRQFNYHSCVITKAEWTFERGGLVTYSYDWDAQYVESTTSLITPTYPSNVVPFNMASTSSTFKAGVFGSEAAVEGIRKATVTIQRKLATERMYLGNQYKALPVTNGLVEVTVALEADYTTAAKPTFEAFLKNEANSVILESVGNQIGSSGISDTFSLNVTSAYVQSGGEAPLDGPELVKNTLTLKGTIDTSNHAAVKAKLKTADSSF
jgi:hypothetical protein